MVEKIPFATEFNDAVMGGPAYNRCKDNTLIGKGPVGVVAYGIAEKVAVTG